MAFAESSWFMRDIFGPQSHLGYCTNVHAGHSLAEIRANLERHAAGVRRIASPDQSLGIGLWLPHGAIADAPFAEFIPLVPKFWREFNRIILKPTDETVPGVRNGWVAVYDNPLC